MIEVFIAWMIVWALWRVSRVPPDKIVLEIEIIDPEREEEEFRQLLKQPLRRQ